jgi:hypothetical protein
MTRKAGQATTENKKIFSLHKKWSGNDRKLVSIDIEEKIQVLNYLQQLPKKILQEKEHQEENLIVLVLQVK